MMFNFNKDAKLIDLGEGLSRKILSYDDNMMAVEVHFEKGSIGKLHTHVHSQISYVISGSFEVRIGNETKILNRGDTYVVSPNEEHGVLCLEKGVLLDIFTPKRDDFLS